MSTDAGPIGARYCARAASRPSRISDPMEGTDIKQILQTTVGQSCWGVQSTLLSCAVPGALGGILGVFSKVHCRATLPPHQTKHLGAHAVPYQPSQTRELRHLPTEAGAGQLLTRH